LSCRWGLDAILDVQGRQGNQDVRHFEALGSDEPGATHLVLTNRIVLTEIGSKRLGMVVDSV
jgi:hypothetical protein